MFNHRAKSVPEQLVLDDNDPRGVSHFSALAPQNSQVFLARLHFCDQESLGSMAFDVEIEAEKIAVNDDLFLTEIIFRRNL